MKRRKSVTNSSAIQTLKKISNDTIPTISYQEAADQFLKHCRIKGLSPETVKFYDKELKQTKRGLVEVDAPLNNIRDMTTDHIESFIEYQQKIGRAVNTINARLRAGRTFFNYCHRKSYIPSNPYDGIQQLRKRHEVGATFTKRQLKRLLDAPDVTTFIGLRDLAIMLTFAHTGIRLTELTSLRLQDISFDDKGAINVQRAKNRYARRIPLTNRLRVALRAYIQERGVLHHDYLFISLENEPMGARGIQDRLKQYGKQTGVSKEVTVSPHAFRRTFCRLKVEAGINIFILQRLSGHQSLEILKRYVEIYGRDLEDAIEQGID
ncbi:tyrosine-type recombinase/integrase [Cytobacillus sp. Sa5YUA1]|uniref:Tyrosine-type recombinase/integrase n=1 Tax=Cytobacillus stercorigallinarum TaxID=2762240 RepID=A0ABR8QND1_9BACI|nr:tyrosine-type recombinase/integrase [Cytobacillus stercorigallinarum]MBD7937036.1 tyrosine-type recombinase/integrase [Cytobacillus stercorigallinarum]